jgi:hypothetical protein
MSKIQELKKELESKRFSKEINRIIDQLISLGAYPKDTVPGNPNTVYTMVQCYGVNWNEWREPISCPHCKADLRNQKLGPPFKREIGFYDMDLDATVSWKCPDCSGVWDR